MDEINVFPHEYQVTRLPRDHGAARHLSLWVQYRGKGKWCIARHHNMSPLMTYDKNGSEDYDGQYETPEERANRRWDSADEAIELAKSILPTLTVNGYTYEDVMRRDPTGEYS